MTPLRLARTASLAVVLAVVVLGATGARAHETGTSSLHLRVDGTDVVGDWELTVRDARALLGLPPGGEPDRLGPSEQADLGRRFAATVSLSGDGRPCPIEILEVRLPDPAPGTPATARLALRAACAGELRSLRIDYPLLFDLDPRHRTWFSLRDSRHTQAGVFHADQRQIELAVEHRDRLGTVLAYGREGAWHVLGGLDHVLFLLCLLLPIRFAGDAAARRRTGARILAIVTAFTVAHSLTLALSVLGVVSLPARPVEVAIALSVFAAAWNNVRPWLPVSAAWMAGAFGLVHGLGFASALVRLGLPSDARGFALAGFNLGVEAGQLAVVALWLPVAWELGRHPAWGRRAVPMASLAIAWLAAVWVLGRGLGLFSLG